MREFSTAINANLLALRPGQARDGSPYVRAVLFDTDRAQSIEVSGDKFIGQAPGAKLVVALTLYASKSGGLGCRVDSVSSAK